MPEFPDITVYIEALNKRILGKRLVDLWLNNPFLLRTVEPPLSSLKGARVDSIERLGKRIAIGFDCSSTSPAPATASRLWTVFHLMVAGRLHWKRHDQKPPGKSALAVLQFQKGFLYLTEAGTKRRASLHIVRGDADKDALDPGGLEVLESSYEDFRHAFTARNHTLKRALTDPRILSGIGNSYSDEILHEARLSPVKLSQKLTDEELERLYLSIRKTLAYWVELLRKHYGDNFPEKVTAFREEMAVHGRFGKPCPVCASPVQRIRYSSNETNYCPVCQTDGKVLADRALSRLLKKDWPRSLDELEKHRLLHRKNNGCDH